MSLAACHLARHSVAVGLFCIGLLAASPAAAQDWSTAPIVAHSVYQAVNGDGTSAYPAGAFPVRLVGVVLNRNDDWLNPAAAYDSSVHLWQMGGEAEIYVQAVNLSGTPWQQWSPNPGGAFTDFGGTACWMGQNYGNHIWHQDSGYNYSDAQWYAELDRLMLNRPGGPTTGTLQPGDLVEIRARTGLAYQGKMNVNELHDNDSAMDWEVVLLEPGFGLPAPAELALADLKTADNAFIFDASGATGGERYQSSLVELKNVSWISAANWGTNQDLQVTDGEGRTFDVHLGWNASFGSSSAPEGWLDMVGILDQKAANGQGGYRLLVMNAADITPLPEPGTLLLLAVAAVFGCACWRRRG
jgi:hypothetical protein